MALFQPDIPQNTGAILRLAACFGVPVDVIEPCGFLLSDRRLARAGMDYAERAVLVRHRSWEAFRASTPSDARLILLTTKGDRTLHVFNFDSDDILLFGQESAGAPEGVHAAADARVTIPILPGNRSLNVAMAAAIALAEALRQTGGLPGGLLGGVEGANA